MNRIATGQVYNSALLGVLTAQSRQAEAGRQVASGYKAVDLKGYASEGAALTAAQTVKARTDTLLANNKVLADRLAAQDDALTGVEQAVGGARKAVADAVASGDGAQLMQKLDSWLGQTTQSLNARFGEDSLFAGGTTDREPVDVTAMADLTAPGAAATRFHDGDFRRTDRLDEGQTAQTGFTASEVGSEFVGIMADIAAYNAPPTGPFGTKLTTAQIDFLQSKLAPLDSATANVRAFTARNGAMQARLDTVTARQSDRADAAAALIDSKASVDPAEAASRLQLAGVALQASAQVFATLSGSSLLDVLRS